MTQVFVNEAFDKVEKAAEIALTTMLTENELYNQLQTLKTLAERNPINITIMKREIAERVSQSESYVV